jgi:hypothetical protein
LLKSAAYFLEAVNMAVFVLPDARAKGHDLDSSIWIDEDRRVNEAASRTRVDKVRFTDTNETGIKIFSWYWAVAEFTNHRHQCPYKEILVLWGKGVGAERSSPTVHG